MSTSVRVLSVAHDVADARIHRIAGALRADGAVVTVEALGDAAAGPDGVQVVTHPARGAAVRAVRALVRPWAGRQDVLVVVDPDLVVPAWVATRVARCALVVDVHEDYLAVARDRPWARGVVGLLARVLVRIVLLFAARAALTTVADDHVPPLRARDRLVVRNLPAVGSLPAAGAPDPSRPRALYVGDVRPSRGLWAMLEGIAGAPGWELDVVGRVAEVSEGELGARAAALGVADRVRFHGRLPLTEAWTHARGAWVGLSLLEDTPAYRAAVPTKLYEYLAVGLPVLATDLPRVRSLLTEAGAGLVVGRPEDLSTTLAHWSEHPDDLATLRACARAWADRNLAAAGPFQEMAAAVRATARGHRHR